MDFDIPHIKIKPWKESLADSVRVRRAGGRNSGIIEVCIPAKITENGREKTVRLNSTELGIPAIAFHGLSPEVKVHAVRYERGAT